MGRFDLFISGNAKFRMIIFFKIFQNKRELTYKDNPNGGRPWGDEGSYDLAARMPMIAITISSSMSVKPDSLL